jgi:argininosuccinate lyase
MNDSEGEVQIAGYEAFDTAHRMMTLLGGLLSAVRIDSAKVHRHIDEAGNHPGRARRLPGAHGGDFLPPGARNCEQARAAHDRRWDDAVQRSVLRNSSRYSPRQLAGPARLSEADFRRFITPEHFIAVRTMPGGPRRRRSPPVSGAIAPKSQTSAAPSPRSPRAKVRRKRCWRAKSPRRIAGA